MFADSRPGWGAALTAHSGHNSDWLHDVTTKRLRADTSITLHIKQIASPPRYFNG